MLLARVVGRHWHALVCDVMSFGFRADDIFKELSVGEVLSICVGGGPSSAVRHALEGGWSREAHLLANMQESQAGLASIDSPYNRPGISSREKDSQKKRGQDVLHGQAMTWEEMDAADAARAAAAASGAPRATRKVVW